LAIELVIFDCDGVLFDSDRANVAFYREVVRRAGVPPLPDDADVACHALASAQLFEKYYGHEPDLLARVKRAAAQTDYAPFFDLMMPRQGLHDVLQTLSERYRTAIATNRGATVATLVERFGLSGLVELAVGVLDVARPKPHPDLVLKCLEHFDVPAERAVYVGDQPSDRTCARAAGVAFVGTGSVAGECTLTVMELGELPELLARL